MAGEGGEERDVRGRRINKRDKRWRRGRDGEKERERKRGEREPGKEKR